MHSLILKQQHRMRVTLRILFRYNTCSRWMLSRRRPASSNKTFLNPVLNQKLPPPQKKRKKLRYYVRSSIAFHVLSRKITKFQCSERMHSSNFILFQRNAITMNAFLRNKEWKLMSEYACKRMEF